MMDSWLAIWPGSDGCGMMKTGKFVREVHPGYSFESSS
jgi:hypothetical protein